MTLRHCLGTLIRTQIMVAQSMPRGTTLPVPLQDQSHGKANEHRAGFLSTPCIHVVYWGRGPATPHYVLQLSDLARNPTTTRGSTNGRVADNPCFQKDARLFGPNLLPRAAEQGTSTRLACQHRASSFQKTLPAFTLVKRSRHGSLYHVGSGDM